MPDTVSQVSRNSRGSLRSSSGCKSQASMRKIIAESELEAAEEVAQLELELMENVFK